MRTGDNINARGKNLRTRRPQKRKQSACFLSDNQEQQHLSSINTGHFSINTFVPRRRWYLQLSQKSKTKNLPPLYLATLTTRSSEHEEYTM